MLHEILQQKLKMECNKTPRKDIQDSVHIYVALFSMYLLSFIFIVYRCDVSFRQMFFVQQEVHVIFAAETTADEMIAFGKCVKNDVICQRK